MQSIIIKFFTQIIQNDLDTINLISKFKDKLFIDPENGIFVFTLPALHQFLKLDRKFSYGHFKKMIYQSSINKILGDLGAKIEIHQANEQHDETLFSLIKG